MSLRKRFGLRIKELRVKNNLTQSKLAEIVGIATKTQSSIETGRSYPSSSVVESYAKAFNIDVSEVMKISHIQDYHDLIKESLKMVKTASETEILIIYNFLRSLLN